MNLPDFTREEFVAFVRGRDFDEPIDHDSYLTDESAWARCAVGEFYTALTGKRLDAGAGSAFASKVADAVGTTIANAMCKSEPETYGDLQLMLEQEKQS